MSDRNTIHAKVLRLDEPGQEGMLKCSACVPRTRKASASSRSASRKVANGERRAAPSFTSTERKSRNASRGADKKKDAARQKPQLSGDMLSFGGPPRGAQAQFQSASIQSKPTNIDPKLAHLDPEKRAQERIKARKLKEKQKQAEKVKEKRENEMREKKLQDGKKDAEKELGARLTKWSGTDGNPKNIRALLGTLHTVLWDGARWKPQAVIVRPADIKKAYRKAMLVVHPDKVRASAPPEHHFIAERVFAALNREFKKFSAVEMR